MAREHLPNLDRQRIDPAARFEELLKKGNGRCANSDRFKANIPSANREGNYL